MEKHELFQMLEQIKKKNSQEYYMLCDKVQAVASKLGIPIEKQVEHPTHPPLHS